MVLTAATLRHDATASQLVYGHSNVLAEGCHNESGSDQPMSAIPDRSRKSRHLRPFLWNPGGKHWLDVGGTRQAGGLMNCGLGLFLGVRSSSNRPAARWRFVVEVWVVRFVCLGDWLVGWVPASWVGSDCRPGFCLAGFGLAVCWCEGRGWVGGGWVVLFPGCWVGCGSLGGDGR